MPAPRVPRSPDRVGYEPLDLEPDPLREDWTVNIVDRALYSPFLAQLVVTRRCNLRCGYCNEYDRTSPPVPLDELKERLDKLKELGALSVELTGGEPMLHPEIFEVIRYARSLRFPIVMMISNAYLFTRERVLELNRAGLKKLQVSIDGVEPNEVTIKVLRPLTKRLKVLAQHATFDVVLSAVVGSAPSSEVFEVVRFAKEHGFTPRVLLLHGGDGQLGLSSEDLNVYRQLRKEIGGRFNEARDYRTRLATTGSAPFKCRAGSRYLYVDEHGQVRWCSQQPEAFEKPLASYQPSDLREQFYTAKECNERCTVGCARTNSAVDEWRSETEGGRLFSRIRRRRGR